MADVHNTVFLTCLKNSYSHHFYTKALSEIFVDNKCFLFCAAEEKERTAVAKYAKNFLPRLFNLIAPVDKEGTDACRLATFETLKCYLKICDRQVFDHTLLVNLFCVLIRLAALADDE